MARIFSWKVKDEYAYLGKVGLVKEWFHQTTQITDNNELSAISRTVMTYSEEEYKSLFNSMAAWATGKGVSLEPYNYYYDVAGSLLMLIGPEGQQGVQGKEGQQGISGATGAAGKGRNVICYRSTPESATTLQAPTGGSFNPDKWDIEYPYSPEDGKQWQDSSEFGEGKKVWMSNADFDNNGYNLHGWVKPICISGPKGDNGADGDNTEFIYKRTKERTELPVPNPPTGTTEEEAKTQGWTDHPMGIGVDSGTGVFYKAEWLSYHTKDEHGVWGTWSTAVLWSSWGEDGADGDGIEYIYAVTSTNYDPPKESIPGNPAAPHYDDLMLHWQEPEIWDYIVSNHWEEDYKFVDESGVTRFWTDDPSDVSDTEPYEWVSMRKKKWDATQEAGIFGKFEDPKLWAHWGKDGEPGKDGTSLNVKGKYDSLYSVLKKLEDDSAFPPAVGDSYAISANTGEVHMWVWMEVTTEGRTLYDRFPKAGVDYTNYYYTVEAKPYWFVDCGKFQGEDGKTAYLHIKYATDWDGVPSHIHSAATIARVGVVDIMFTDQDKAEKGETPGPYVAQYSDNIYTDNDNLEFYCENNLWVKYEGDDGQSFGQEQVFFRTFGNELPSNFYYKLKDGDILHGFKAGDTILSGFTYPAEAFTTSDWVPTVGSGADGWTDRPKGLEDNKYNFEWVATRRLIDKNIEPEFGGEWSYFGEPRIYTQATDTERTQIEYTTYSGDLRSVKFDKFTGEAYPLTTADETAWRNKYSTYGTWSDNAKDAVWKLTCYAIIKSKEKGVAGKTEWSDWKVEKIKGATEFAAFAYVSLPEGVNISNIQPKNGTFTNPIPDKQTASSYTITWKDVPEGKVNEVLWMTKAMFTSEEPTRPITSTTLLYGWSLPSVLADTNDFEVMYASFSGEPYQISAITGFKKIGKDIDTNWLTRANAKGWFDEVHEVTGGDITYMAQIRGINNKFEDKDWQITRIKGATEFVSYAYFAADEGVILSGLTPTGGTYDNPIPGNNTVTYTFSGKTYTVTVKWTDGPKAEPGQILWMTKASFKSSVSGPSKAWTTPTSMADTNDFEVMYGAFNGDPYPLSAVTGFKKIGLAIDPVWYAAAKAKGWYDDVWEVTAATHSAATHMATIKGTNNSFKDKDWQISKVKGESGDTKFISFVYALLPEGIEEMTGITPTGGTFASPKPTAPTGVTHKGTTYPITWTDGPTGGGNGKALWMSKATFDSATPSSPITPGWSKPTLLADTEDFEVMYGAFTGTPEPMPSGFTKVGVTIDATWYAAAKAKGWYDDVDEVTAATHSAVTHQAQIKGKNNKFNDGDWQIFKVKGEDGQSGKSDVDWLKEVFGSGVTVNPDEAALKGLIGVVDSANNVKAFMNGKSAYSSAKDGTLMIAAGVEGMSDPNTAKFRVYENGTIYAENANIQGTVNATNGYIGGIEIGAGGLSSANFGLSSDGKVTASDININNDNITIDNSGIVFKNAGLPALSVNAKTYNSSSEWITTGSTASTSYSAITVWSGQGTNVVQKGAEWQWSTNYETPYVISAGTLNISSYSKLKISGKINYYLTPYNVGGAYGDGRASISSNMGFHFISGDSGYDVWETKILNAYYYSTINCGVTFTKELLIPAGVYNFVISDNATLGMMVIPQLPDTAGTYSGKWEIGITGLEITVTPQQDYTEIFKNGFGTKADVNNYFFVCKDSTDNKITFEVVSDGKKMILDETGLKLAPKKLTKITTNGVGLSSCTKYEEIIWDVPVDDSEIILPSSANMKDGEIIYLNTTGNIYKLKCSSRTWIGVGDTRGWYNSGNYSPMIRGVTVVKIIRMGTDMYAFITKYP